MVHCISRLQATSGDLANTSSHRTVTTQHKVHRVLYKQCPEVENIEEVITEGLPVMMTVKMIIQLSAAGKSNWILFVWL